MRCVLIFLLSATLHATDLGVHGKLFPIEERNLLEVIAERLSDIEISEGWQEQVRQSAAHPKPVEGIEKAASDRTFLWDPTFQLSKEIRDGQGDRLFAKGTTVNPLTHTPLPKTLLFFDGSDPEQVSWAREQESTSYWILVRGSPLRLEEREGRQVFFDQFGAMTKRFGIRAVPARVTQRGLQLLVEELTLEGGDSCSL